MSLLESDLSDVADDPTLARFKPWAPVVLVALLAWLAWSGFHEDGGQIFILGAVDIAVHECGHLLYLPFGDTMHWIGGSLFQIQFPLIFAAYFFFPTGDRKRNTYAAMVCTWWASLNMNEVAMYMADSRAGQLMLLTGETASEGSPHDWRYLLSKWGVLQKDTLYAGRLRSFGVMVCVVSLAVALYISLTTTNTSPVSVAETSQ